MAEDVIVRDDLIEFKNTQRCVTCQTRNRDCIMRMGADACLLCADTGPPCVFERIVRLRGLATEFPRDLLLAIDSDFDLKKYDFRIPQPQARDTDGPTNRSSPTAMEVDSPNASISAARFAVDHRSINYPETQSHRRWRRVLIFIKAIVSLREGSRKRVDGLRKGDVQASLSSFKVFDLNMQPQSSLRVTERLISLDDKLLAQKDRKPAACAVCRAKKQKCSHKSTVGTPTADPDTMSDSAEQSISSALQATETVSDPGGVPIDCNTRTFNTSLYGPTPSSNSSSGGSTSTAPYGYPSLNARASSPASSISDHVGSRKKLSSKKDIPYVCLHPGCSRAFARMYDLDRHCKTHYPQTTQKFDCPEAVKGSFCGRMGDRGFTRNDHLNEHLRKVHHYDIRTRDTCELSAMPHPSSIRHLTSPRTGPSILPKPVINRTPLVDYSALSAGAWDSHVPPSYRISASDTLGEEQAT